MQAAGSPPCLCPPLALVLCAQPQHESHHFRQCLRCIHHKLARLLPVQCRKLLCVPRAIPAEGCHGMLPQQRRTRLKHGVSCTLLGGLR